MKTRICMCWVLLAALTVSACAVGGHTYVPHQADLTNITIKIVNDHWLQAKVYVLYGNARPERLMTVTTRGETKVNGFRAQSAGLRIHVKLFADRWQTWTSELLFWARPGDCVEVRVGAMLSTSTVMPCF